MGQYENIQIEWNNSYGKYITNNNVLKILSKHIIVLRKTASVQVFGLKFYNYRLIARKYDYQTYKYVLFARKLEFLLLENVTK